MLKNNISTSAPKRWSKNTTGDSVFLFLFIFFKERHDTLMTLATKTSKQQDIFWNPFFYIQKLVVSYLIDESKNEFIRTLKQKDTYMNK